MKAAPEYDFDEWAELYRTDPVAFEARRKAMLALELAKVSPASAAPVRDMLAAYERRVDGKSDAVRIKEAARMTMESLTSLSDKLRILTGDMQTLRSDISKQR